MAFDRWRINDLKRELEAIGAEIPLVECGQGFRDMAVAVDILERAIIEGNLRHGNNPVLTMCASNVVIAKDASGNRKFEKAKSSGRIDGIVALSMGLKVAGSFEEESQLPACLQELA